MKDSIEFSIGEFSKASGLTIKTLRFYHERGLLVPARVEAGSGYRFYDKRNLETAKIIAVLRSLEFSLDEIHAFLKEGDHGDETVVDYLERRKSQVQDHIRAQREILGRLDQIIEQEKVNQVAWNESGFKIEERTLESMLIGGVRMTGRYSDMGEGFGRLGKSLWRNITGAGMCLFFDEDYRETDANFEPFFPLKKKARKNIEGVSVRELEGGKAVCLKHRGSYEELGRTYGKLFEHLKANNLQPCVPSREVYLKGPGIFFKGNPSKYLTEIQILVKEG